MVTAVKPRKSKPLPLVDLFRKTKNDSFNEGPSLGSGVQNLPHSSLDMGGFEPYTPNTATLVNSLIRSKSRSRNGQDIESETLFSPTTAKPEPAYTTAAPSRSRSLSRDTRTTDTVRTRSSSRSRSYSVGEQSFIDTHNLPPVPSIPPEHQLATKLSKASINSSNLSSPRSPKYASDMDRRPKYSHEQERNDFTIQHSEPLGRSKSQAPSRSRSYGSKDTCPPTPVSPVPTSPLHSRRMRACTMSSQSSSDEEDNIPLAATNIAPPWLQNRRLSMGTGLHVNLDRSIIHSSLLDDDEEEDDEDHIPIAILSPIRGEFMTAADKYKEKVRERMFKDQASSESSDEQEDDNIPIQQIIQQRKQRRSSDDSPSSERRGRSRNPSRITASEKRARSRAEKDHNIPPVPSLPPIYNIS
ncbi:hypothetical protein K450DRAFT_244550 [Umbelopsis ramanniana AG]|uniref:Uncharacterized protein n=1 Tax=Umbelopsis ramanniana AG TaxID=1314678 RepID=A0AAD5E954_UMBRA|nr:uncharacterized protein K450DRAFT_244550 [Umbelopsis ramanniana AG]KAI8579012.1 hypothetical protein K450DRAFT_244550 [Umbelopsis ramanniana AG]